MYIMKDIITDNTENVITLLSLVHVILKHTVVCKSMRQSFSCDSSTFVPYVRLIQVSI